MGVYAEFSDVSARYEDEMPDDRQTWVELRIDDAEAELFGLIPGLASGSVAISDPPRATRVRRLICDKVLALYRNPDGALTVSNTMGSLSESRTLPGSRLQSGSWVAFTDEELARVGYSTTTSAGSVALRAWHYDQT